MTSNYDRQLWDKGIARLCGIDEVGRGPFAGPVVAAAVILDPYKRVNGLDDSKKLTAARRELLAPRIRARALDWAIGEASVEEIDKLNIVRATFLAMQRALSGLKAPPGFILIDGRDNPTLFYKDRPVTIKSRALIKGDTLSRSIAAASIIAKVFRDELMAHYAESYPQYGFDHHKGYGTKMHCEALLQHGPCPLHRRSFTRKLFERNGQTGLFNKNEDIYKS